MRGVKRGEMAAIVHSLEPITLVGAGSLRDSDIDDSLALAPTLVAADGGAAHCLAADHMPEAVIGDLDSLDMVQAASIPWERLHEITEQVSTDFDKALRHIVTPLVVAVGFTGARTDHELAAYNVLVQRADRRCVLVGETDVLCAVPPKLALDVPVGTRVSLFPMRDVTGRSEGLKWPIAGIEFAPGGPIGTSNAATAAVTLEMDGPGMLLILPKAFLPLLVKTLLATPEAWPAP